MGSSFPELATVVVSALVIVFAMAVIHYPVAGTGQISGELTRPLALLPLGLYGLYLFIQAQDTADHVADPERPAERRDHDGREFGEA